MGPIVQRLKAIREQAGLSLVQMAETCGWADHTQASRVERGVKVTTVDKIETWIDAAGCDVYVVERVRLPAAASMVPLLAGLGDRQRGLVLRLARLMVSLSDDDLDRLSSDMDYLEGRKRQRR